MPVRVRIPTNQGIIEFQTDRPPKSKEEAMAALEEHIASQGGEISVAPSQGVTPPSRRLPFAGIIGRDILSALEAVNAPIEAAGEFVKGIVKPPIEKALTAAAPFTLPRLLGIEKSKTPEQEQQIASEIAEFPAEMASQAVQFVSPGKFISGAQKVVKGVGKILPGSQAARVEMGIEKVKGAISALAPSVGSETVRNVALADPSIRVPMAAVYDDLQGVLKSAKAASTPDSELVKVAENLASKINRKGNTLTLADVQAELTAIGERVNNLKSQGQAVNPGFSRIYGSIAKGLEKVPEGAQLRQASHLYRREKGIEEINEMMDKVIMHKRGTGAQDINAERMLKELKRKPFVTESFEPGELREVTDLLEKLVKMPALPPPRGAAFGAGLSAFGGGLVAGPMMAMGVDPAIASGVGLTTASLMELSRRLLPSPIGRKALRAVLESGPIDQNKINMLAAVARGISSVNIAPPQSQ